MTTATLPASNITFRQVERLRKRYNALCLHGEYVVFAYDRDPSSENLRAMLDQVKAVDLAYKLWDQAHRECYGF